MLLTISDDVKLDILGKLALFWNPRSISDHVLKTYKVAYSERSIRELKDNKSNQLVIDRIRNKYMSSIMEVPLTFKRMRLEQYTELYDSLKALGEYSQAAKILDYIRDEVEGKTAGVQNVYLTQVNISDEELMQEKLKSLEQLELLRKRRNILGIQPKNGASDATDSEGR